MSFPTERNHTRNLRAAKRKRLNKLSTGGSAELAKPTYYYVLKTLKRRKFVNAQNKIKLNSFPHVFDNNLFATREQNNSSHPKPRHRSRHFTYNPGRFRLIKPDNPGTNSVEIGAIHRRLRTQGSIETISTTINFSMFRFGFFFFSRNNQHTLLTICAHFEGP